MSYSSDMSKEIIMDHLENPRNKNKSHDNYLETTLKNPSCGDEITLYLKCNKNNIEDITYNVKGCSICSASISIMSELLISKNINEVNEIIVNFDKMMINENFNENIIEDAIVFRNIPTIPARIKCATLSYNALKKLLEKGCGNNV